MSTLLIDISNNNGRVLFAPLVPQGVKGVLVKATEGNTFTDKWFGYNRAQAKQHGLHFGAYHFFRPDVDAALQAEHFCAVVQTLRRTDLKPVLDFETGGLSKQAAFDAIRAFNKVVKKRLGKFPLFYSYSAFIQELGLPHPVGDGLWLANFGQDDGVHEYPYETPKPWKRTHLHQFTQHGHLTGITGDVDLSFAPHGLKPLLAHPWLAKL